MSLPSRSPVSRVLGTVLVLVCLTLAACGNDGKTLRPPQSGATAPLRTTSTTAAPGSSVGPTPGLLSLTSPAFEPGGSLPDDLTCDGVASPPLSWSGLPEGVVEVALTVVDQDAELFTHWVVAGLDPAIAAIPEGAVPEDAVIGLNSAGVAGWEPLCPPGDETHTYEFTLHALSQPSGLTPGLPADQAITALNAVQGWRAVITATGTD